MKRAWPFLALATLALLASAVVAQVSTNFDLSWHVLSGGGGTHSSTNYQLHDSLGQSPEGRTTSASYEIGSGFWYGVVDVVPGNQDAYEVDDACNQARTINTNGSAQSHTFHDQGDEDWVKFDAQANKTYVIEVHNVGDNVDAVVMLHDVCNAPPLSTDDNAFGPTARLAWNSPAAGEYYVGLVQNDPSLYGEGANYELSVSLDTEKPAAPRNVRVDPDNEALQVQWSRSTSLDVVSYGVRWGTTSGGPYSFQSVDGADSTFHRISGLNNDQPYYIVLTSFDFSGNESLFSVEVGGIPRPDEDTTNPSLTVNRPTSGTVYSTTVSLLTVGGTATDAGNNLSRVKVRNATNNAEGWAYNLSGGSSAFQVESIPLAIGDNQIQLTVYDTAENTGAGGLTIRRISGLNGAVVIVGGRNNSSSLQANINNGTNRAYRVFRSAGFGTEDIYYLSPSPQDADGDGFDDRTAETTPDNVHTALLWAAGRVGEGIPFYLYMFDHGGIESFCGQGCTVSGRIGSDILDGWLDELESTSHCDRVNVIIEACHSGSFIDRVEGVAQSLSKDGRVIIASTGRTNNAYASAQGAYFSDAFFSAVAESSDLLTCFSQAKAAVDAAGVPQTPWIDDNGDGLYTPGVDGSYADDRYVASYFGTMLPEITSASVELSDGTGTISAWVARGDEPVTVVWAAVYAPSFQAPTETTLELGVPLIELQADPEQPGRYSAYYNNFGEEGSYRVVVYALDRATNQAAPRVVRTGAPQESIFLPLVLRNAQ